MQDYRKIVTSHLAVTHSVFDAIEKGLLSKEAIETFMCVHYPIVEPYSQYLVNILSFLNQKDKLILMKNINAEFGNGIISNCHNKLYEKLLDKSGLYPIKTAENHIYIETLTNLSRNKETLLGALAISGIATENVTIPIFTKIYNGLINHYGYKEEDLTYFTVHINIDEEHADEVDEIIESLRGQLIEPFFDSKIEYYVKLGLDLRLKVWESAIARFPEQDKSIVNYLVNHQSK
jgi:pyrroloquinoline-quinone synthase